ncbi:hypothetical protein M885DRAFT_591323 [Pelagophyceae sp. CCMP2097]|nr:hypothetical protein M885DRAFT_591323 [Pelagophyceae sp. CCMP2097]
MDVALPRNVSRDGRDPEECFCVVCDEILTREECASLKRRASSSLKYITEAKDNERSGASVVIQSPRRYQLAAFQDEPLAVNLWRRIQEAASPALDKYARCNGLSPPRGLNARLRVLRYAAGDRFEPHYDREVPSDDGLTRSLVTVLLYLNDGGGDFEGGETWFLDANNATRGRAAVVPRCGRAVLFEHGLFHSGATVDSGEKFVMRTDVLFDVAESVHAPLQKAPAESIESLLHRLDLPHLREPLDEAGLLISLAAFVEPGKVVVEAILGELDLEGVDALVDAAFRHAA